MDCKNIIGAVLHQFRCMAVENGATADSWKFHLHADKNTDMESLTFARSDSGLRMVYTAASDYHGIEIGMLRADSVQQMMETGSFHYSVQNLVCYYEDVVPAIAGMLQYFDACDGTIFATQWQGFEYDGRVLSAAFSSDNIAVTLVAVAPVATAGAADGCSQVRLFRAGSQTPHQTYHHGGVVFSGVMSSDGRILATGSSDTKARLFDSNSSNPFLTYEHEDTVLVVAISPDGGLLATGCRDNTARLFSTDRKCPKLLMVFRHPDAVLALAFAPNNTTLATGCSDNKARVFSTDRPGARRTYEHNGAVRSVAVSPDGKLLATGCDDCIARLYGIDNLDEDEMMVTNATLIPAHSQSYEHDSTILSVAFRLDSSMLVTGCSDGKARTFSVDSPIPIQIYDSSAAVCTVAFSPDGDMMAAGCDNQVALYDATPSRDRCATLLFLVTWVQADAQYNLPFSTMDECDNIRAYYLVFEFLTSSLSNFRLVEKALNPKRCCFEGHDEIIFTHYGVRKALNRETGDVCYLQVPMSNYHATFPNEDRVGPLKEFLGAFFAFCRNATGDPYPFSYAACRLPPQAYKESHFNAWLTPSEQRQVYTTVLAFQRLYQTDKAHIPIELVQIILMFCMSKFDAPIYNKEAVHNVESDPDTDDDEDDGFNGTQPIN